MKTIINNVEFTEIEYVFAGESEAQHGILVHDLTDIKRDGDCIYGNGVELPATEEDASNIINNEYGNSYFHIENGIYILD